MCASSLRGRSARACFFFFNDTATTEIYTLSLHDALPICLWALVHGLEAAKKPLTAKILNDPSIAIKGRSEEHTSELQSQSNLVCRLLLEKKKKDRQHQGPVRSNPPLSPPDAPLEQDDG